MRRHCTPSLHVCLLVVACGGGGDGSGGSSGSSEASATDPSDTDPSATDPSDTDPTDADTSGGDPNDAEMMCERWLADRADMSEGAWSGDVAACDPGDIDAVGRENTLRVLNLFRWLADLPPVTSDPALDAKGQACALMMTANMTLSHGPTPDWTCYSTEGAEAAGSSNIATTPAVASVDLYMMDPGNPDTIGHRRWILSNTFGPTGIGSTSQYSCLATLGGTANLGVPWVAYPSPGPFPLAATTIGFSTLDQTGWSIQSDTIDLGAAVVEVTRDGMALPMTVVPLAGGYGSTFAISMIPMGWQTTVGEYHVVVSGVAEGIEYDVEIVDCGG